MEQLAFALSQVHKIYKVQFVVIIDEWDAVFRESKDDTEAQKEYIAFLCSLFKDAPTKKFIKLAYLTGILPIKKYGTESALNNFDEFTMLEADVWQSMWDLRKRKSIIYMHNTIWILSRHSNGMTDMYWDWEPISIILNPLWILFEGNELGTIG